MLRGSPAGFAALPPEVNSARMYAGPGSAPLLAAAAAWRALADEMHSAETDYESALRDLSSSMAWHGPSSASMWTAAAPFVTWLHTTAGQAEQTGVQGNAAAMAFEAAYAATVPPTVVVANRTLLANLGEYQYFGQNTPAIAAGHRRGVCRDVGAGCRGDDRLRHRVEIRVADVAVQHAVHQHHSRRAGRTNRGGQSSGERGRGQSAVNIVGEPWFGCRNNRNAAASAATPGSSGGFLTRFWMGRTTPRWTAS